MRHGRWAVLCAALHLGGCGTAAMENPDVGTALGSVGAASKADDVGARTIRWDDSQAVDIDVFETRVSGIATITSVTDDSVDVSSDRLVLRPNIDQDVTLSIAPAGWTASLTQDIAFVLAWRIAGEEDWLLVELPVEIDGQHGELFLFEDLTLRPPDQALEFHGVLVTDLGLERITATVPFVGAAGQRLEYGVIPIPTGAWGDLAGDYEYVVDATCDSDACEHSPID
jgi:hypothetical protein